MDLAIHLDSDAKTPLYRQLTEAIRQAILEGRLKTQQKLPSSRNLAKSLAISRFTVTQSYEQLESEGYLATRKGAGTFVSSRIPDEWFKPSAIAPVTSQNVTNNLSKFGRNLTTIDRLSIAEPNYEISFRYGNPAIEYFPINEWRKLINLHCQKSPETLHYFPDGLGYLPLRQAIADYLGRARAVRCDAEHIAIVSGSQQALNLISRLLLDAGDWVAVEEPGYLGAKHCFRGQLANLAAIKVNSDGLDVEALNNCPQDFKLAYVTPSHQFPTGVTMSLSQRISLLQWAEKTNTFIVEDDYDSEYRYESQPIPALQGMDQANLVIYIGTFSKVIFPALRLGYLVLPPNLVPIFRKAKWLCDRFCPLVEQYALTDWIRLGHFERHIRKMRQLYNLRRQALIAAFERYFGNRATILGENAGIHLMAKIHTTHADEIIIQQAAAAGIGLVSARGYYQQPQQYGEFIFGYGQLSETEIDRGICKLAKVINNNCTGVSRNAPTD